MAQPIKKQTINPWNYFSKELTVLIDFITKVNAPLFGIKEITPELFMYSALENVDCLLYKVLNSYLTSMDIETLHDEIGSKLIKANDFVGGKVEFSKPLFDLFLDAYDMRNATESQYITSDHVLMALLSQEQNKTLVALFKRVGVTYSTLLDLSKEVHDVVTNDVDKINNTQQLGVNNSSFGEFFGGVRVIKGTPSEVISAIQKEITGEKNKMKKPGNGIDFCTNITQQCETDNIENLIGREKELRNIYNVLGRKKCNNALLVGEPGVGKSQCVLGLAKHIYNGESPLQFRNKQIWKLNPTELMAGTQLRGMFEERLLTLTKQLKANPNVILFIDDIDNLFGGNKTVNSDFDAGGILNEVLSDGSTQIIATTSIKKYKSIVDNNPDIAEKFQKITIEKPSIDECVEILVGTREYYEKFHNVKYSDEIVYQVVTLCNRYITEKQLPASAFDVLDELGSYKKLNSIDNNTAADLSRQIKQLEGVKDTYIKKDLMNDANDISIKINEFRDRLARLQANMNRRSPQKVTMEDLYHVISEHTNIPISKISTPEKDELKQISEKLKNVVVGQDEAIDVISRAIKRNQIGLTTNTRPRLVVLAVGESGVGKTLIAKTLAKEIYGDEKYLVRFDMSEYSDETSINKLIGSSAGYVGYTEGGLLTEAIKNKKYCVLLIDEIEKAHNKVYNLFLQVFDEGFLTDNTGNKVDFKNTIIIMTSNVGTKQAANTKGIGFNSDNAHLKDGILKKELKNKFPPEFLNRIDDIVYFNSLTDDNLKDIIKLELGYLKKRVNAIYYDITYSEEVIQYIFDKVVNEREYGARPIYRAIRDTIENKITDLLIDNDYPLGNVFTVRINEEKTLEVI